MNARRMCVYRRYAPALPHEKTSKPKSKKGGKSIKSAFNNHSNRGGFGKERIRIRRIRPVPKQITGSI